jgi:hypothetical protein
VLVSGVVLHTLPPGYRFDLRARVLLPRLQAVPAAGRGAGRTGPRPRRRAGGEAEQEASR